MPIERMVFLDNRHGNPVFVPWKCKYLGQQYADQILSVRLRLEQWLFSRLVKS